MQRSQWRVMRQCTERVLLWGSMAQPNDATDALAMMQAQLQQAMIEHEIVVQVLRAQTLVSLLFVLVLSCICYFLWKRHSGLNAAFLAEIARHSVERQGMLKQQSLELVALQMQMLHAFEGIVSRRRPPSASSQISSVSPMPPRQPSTSSSRATPVPPPLPTPVPSRRTPSR